MALCRTIAVTALLWSANVDAFVPHSLGVRESFVPTLPGAQTLPAITSRLCFVLYMSTQSPPDLNFYRVLGISKGANDGDIKQAYRKLAKLYHPDVNPSKDTTEQFQALNRAYEVLSDPSLKKNYDMFGGKGIGTSAASDVEVGERVNKQDFRRGADVSDLYENADFFGNGRKDQKRYSSGPVGFDTSPGSWDGPRHRDADVKWESMGNNSRSRNRRATVEMNSDGVDDVEFEYDDWFGPNRRESSRDRAHGVLVGDDLALDYEVDFKTAVLGGTVTIPVSRIEQCEPCTGTGSKPGSKTVGCGTCGGSGVTIPLTKSGPVFSISCHDCNGTGKKIFNACGTCHGTAVRHTTATVEVDIPAGVMPGNKIRVRGEGDVGPNAGPTGDLYLFLKVRADPEFRREGSDIFAEATISCIDAIVGSSMKVKTVDGETTIDIPAGTQPGHVICVKGVGAPSLIGEAARGDHFVEIDVEIPNGDEDKDDELVKLLKQSATTTAGKKSPSPSYFTGSATTDKSKSTTKKEVLAPHNFSAPFPKATKEAKTTNASVPFPKSGTATVATVPDSSTTIDKKTLDDLNALVTEGKLQKAERDKFEELAALREKEIEEHAKLLEELKVQSEEDRRQRVYFEQLAASREEELKENEHRHAEMNTEINVRVRQAQGQTSRITVKKSIEMSRIFNMIARQKGLRVSDMKFSLAGNEIDPDDTPFDLKMENNCVVDVSSQRSGVGSARLMQ